jgi:hypothetical protein
MLQQIGNPFGVLDIRLTPWDRFDMLRIDDEHRKIPDLSG